MPPRSTCGLPCQPGRRATSSATRGRPSSHRGGHTGHLADPAHQVGDRVAVGVGGATQRRPGDRAASARPGRSGSVWKTCWSRACRSSERARRKAWNRPCGSMATWQNCGEVEPDETGDEVAGLVEAGGQRVPGCGRRRRRGARRSRRGPARWSSPVPRFLGLLPGGRAVDAEPAAGQRGLEDHPRSDVVARPGRSAAAWRRRGRRARRRRARSRPRRGRWTCRLPSGR